MTHSVKLAVFHKRCAFCEVREICDFGLILEYFVAFLLPFYSFLSFATPFIPVSIKPHSSLSRVHHIDDPPALQHTRCTHPVDSITRHWPYQQQQLSIPKLVQTVHGGSWRHACLHAGLLLSPWSKSWYMAHEISVNFAHSQCEFSVKLGLFLKHSVK